MKINKIMLYIVLFFGLYGLILGLTYLPGKIFIPITLAESLNFQIAVASMNFGTFLELFLAAPVEGVILLLLYEELMKKPRESEKYIPVIKILLAIFAASMFNGIGVHFAANLADTISGPVTTATNKELLVYFLDEAVGHKLIHFGIFGIFVILIWLHQIGDPERISRLDIILYVIAAVVIGIIFAFALIEGQAAFDLLILNGILIPTLLILNLKKRIDLRKNQVALFQISFSSVQIIVIVIWWITTGLLFGFQPYYPFIFQYHFFF
ncbi:MAG: hypothetical protein ACXQS8_07890 [Candidatus Helarchaeales archaeon]